MHYQLKQGKWRTDALAVNGDKLWWVTVSFSRRIRGPISGFLHFNQKARDNTELWREGPAIVQLATGRIFEFTRALDKLLDDPFFEMTIFMHLNEPEDAADAQFARFFAVSMILYNSAAFDRRTVRPLTSLPYTLFHLAKQGRNQALC